MGREEARVLSLEIELEVKPARDAKQIYIAIKRTVERAASVAKVANRSVAHKQMRIT